jgi:hypothetical protein
MRKVWAIVRLTLAESIRTRVAVAFILLLVGVMILLVSTATGDGTVRGKIQMFLSYSMSLTHFLLTLLVAFLACRSLDQDIKTLRIDSVVTKPIARWQLLLGRWLGILILAVGLFAVSMGTVYGVVCYFARSAPADSRDRFEIENQVLVARQNYRAPLPDFTKEVDARIETMKNEGSLPEDKSLREIRGMIAAEMINRSRTVDAGKSQSWKFTGLKQPEKGDVIITLRFEYEPSITTTVNNESQLHGDTILGRWLIGSKALGPDKVYAWQEEKPYRTKHEINIPVNAIDNEGTMTIAFENIDPRGVSVHFPMPDGIQVLIREGGFTMNFVRTAMVSFFTIVFVMTLAMACGTFLSFPIAVLMTLSVFFIGLGGNFLYEAIGLEYVIMPQDTTLDIVKKIIAYILSGKNIVEVVERVVSICSLVVVPKLEVSRFTSNLVDGRLLEWKTVTAAFASLIVFKGCFLALFAAFVFHRRELGKVIV